MNGQCWCNLDSKKERFVKFDALSVSYSENWYSKPQIQLPLPKRFSEERDFSKMTPATCRDVSE